MSNSVEQFSAFRPPRAISRLRARVHAIKAWPAAGGGLLVGTTEPSLAGGRPLSGAIKTAFLRIGLDQSVRCMLPYVALQPEVQACIAAVVASELVVSEDTLSVIDGRDRIIEYIADLHPDAESSLAALCAAAHCLIVTAAAECWGVSAQECRTTAGTVLCSGLAAGYGDLAADAALLPIPRQVALRCGRSVLIT